MNLSNYARQPTPGERLSAYRTQRGWAGRLGFESFAMKRWLKILERTIYAVAALICAAILTVGGYFVFQVWSFSRPAVPARKLARLSSNMDTNQVRRLLGPPTSAEVFTNAQGRTTASWIYSRPNVWNFVVISFDADGNFAGHFED